VRKYILLCALMLGFTALASPGGVIFILDASNSMNISFQGMPRIQWAKDALGELVMELPDEMPFGLSSATASPRTRNRRAAAMWSWRWRWGYMGRMCAPRSCSGCKG